MSKSGDLRGIERLPFLDGIRGLAALTVAVGHAVRSGSMLDGGQPFFSAPLADRLVWLAWPGNEMVFLFLVVSGFALFHSEDVNLSRRGPTSFGLFAKRRAWRILPLYYVALAWGFLILALIPRTLLGDVATIRPPVVTLGGVLAHLALLHNLQDSWLHQINAPLWSMAYEAQLYLVFPLLYLASKRFNPLLVAFGALMLDAVFHHFYPDVRVLGLLRWFALGIMLAAVYRQRWIQSIPRWILIGGAWGTVLFAYLRYTHGAYGFRNDAVWGIAFVFLFLAMTRVPFSRWNPANARWLRWLGARSYSLYALHVPVLLLVYAATEAVGMDGWLQTASVTVIGIGGSVLVAMGAYRFVERPSMERARNAGRTDEAERPSPLRTA